VSGLVLHHEAAGAGDAPSLLMVGSLGTTLQMWEPQLEPLSSRFRVIRLDLRGHGRSPVPDGPYSIADLGADVLATCERLGVARTSYCGLSIGGMIGMWVAANAPELVDRLVLISTSAHLDGSAYAERAAVVRSAGTTEVVADAVVQRWFTPSWAAEHPAVVDRHRRMIAGTPAEGYAGCCEAVAGVDLRAELARISAPTQVIAGADDPATPPVHGRAVADAIPGARLVVLDDAAHLANVQQAAAIASMIAEHLDHREQR